MSESTAVASKGATRSAGNGGAGRPGRSGRSGVKLLIGIALLVVLLALPLYVPEFWLRTGFAVFGADTIVRRLIDPEHTIEHWSEFERGGHFPAMEVPDLLIGDIRTFFRPLRTP